MDTRKGKKDKGVYKELERLVKNSYDFLKTCKKPSLRETLSTLKVVSIGFATLGTIGYIVKIIHIPINNILAK